MINKKIVHVFCVDGLKGNPSLVLFTQDRIDVSFCIAESLRLGCEVTLIHQDPSRPHFELKFFTAAGEIQFCGHGILAAAMWLSVHRLACSPISFQCAGRLIIVEQNSPQSWEFLQPAFNLEQIDAQREVGLALEAIGLSASLAGAKLLRSIGADREKLLLQLADAAHLKYIVINPTARDAICKQLLVTGIYVFAIVSSDACAEVNARHFPIASDDQEDMATGAIAPTVAKYLGNSIDQLKIKQGGRDCQYAQLLVSRFVSRSVSQGLWKVAGECVIASHLN